MSLKNTISERSQAQQATYNPTKANLSETDREGILMAAGC